MMELITQPWPWYVAGPILGLVVPLLLVLAGRQFGISSSLRHACAATVPAGLSYFKYNWKEQGAWNLWFVLGIALGGVLAATLFQGGDAVAISAATQADLAALGVEAPKGLYPSEIFSWNGLLSLPGALIVIGGGFLVGFGARYADGCTSGHAIMGLAMFQKSSLIAVLGFFAGGMITTYLLLPLIL